MEHLNIPVLIDDEEKTFKMAGALEAEGVFVNPIVPPAVPEEASLIRISITAGHSEEGLETALDKLGRVGRHLGNI